MWLGDFFPWSISPNAATWRHTWGWGGANPRGTNLLPPVALASESSSDSWGNCLIRILTFATTIKIARELHCFWHKGLINPLGLEGAWNTLGLNGWIQSFASLSLYLHPSSWGHGRQPGEAESLGLGPWNLAVGLWPSGWLALLVIWTPCPLLAHL